MALLNPNPFDAERLTAEQKRRLGLLYSAAPDLQEACEASLAWLTNVNTSDPLSLSQKIMAALRKSGYDEARLDSAAVAMLGGACRYTEDDRKTVATLARHCITYGD